MENNVKRSTRVVTGPGIRFCYCYVWEPRSNNRGPAYYSVTPLIPKTDTETAEKIRAAMRNAYEEWTEKMEAAGEVYPSMDDLRTALRDGDAEHPGDPVYAGCWFLNASSAYAPGIVDSECRPIRERSEFYSGCYGRISMGFYVYNNGEKAGIGCRLHNLQKLKDGERLGGVSASEDFGAGDRRDGSQSL